MKNRNQYREAPEDKLRALEGGSAFFSRVAAWLRAVHRRGRWLRISLALILLVLVSMGGYASYCYVFDQSQQLRLGQIIFRSSGILNQQDVLDYLELEPDERVASIDSDALTQRLRTHPLVSDARVYTELPQTLHIRVEEHLPVVYVKRVASAGDGSLFIDPKGVLFPVDTFYHRDFLNSPTWFVEPDDYDQLVVGAHLNKGHFEPIIQMIKAINAYELAEIPRVVEIYRPKPWKLVLTLETGSQVLMKSFDIEDQVKRLHDILEYARAHNKGLRSINVIPSKNPAVKYLEL